MTTTQTPQVCKFTARDTRLAQESLTLDREIKKLAARKRVIDAELEAKMQAHGALLATYRTSAVAEMIPVAARWTLDSARIKVEQPEIAKLYTKPPSDKMHIQYLLAI